mgnify:CR=1 FL=1
MEPENNVSKMFYTLLELAARWEVSRKVVLDMCLNKTIPSLKIGKTFKILGSEVIKFEKQGLS